MKSKFRIDPQSCSIDQESHFEAPAIDSNAPGGRRFVNAFAELLGDDSDPDPQFFVECWTLGVQEAMGNLQIRLHEQADRDEESIDTGLLEELLTSVLLSPGVWHFNFRERQEFGRYAAEAGPETEARGENAFAEEYIGSKNTAYPMTLDRARQLLGVSVASTAMQIKAAYRQKVREWHPDRLSDQNKAARQFATEKMTEINEAYHLLRIPVV